MSRAKRRKGKREKGTTSDRQVEVQLAPTVELLHREISEALCAEVFRDVRSTERERKWSLFSLSRFWLAVILDPPPSLSAVLARTRRRDPRGLLPMVEASSSAFFQKCKNLPSGFFMGLHSRFIDAVLPKAPRQYCGELKHLQEKFSDVVIFDGSRLDKIAHRLKILWSEKAAVLPGCLLAVYDLFRGIATHLWFDPDAASSEFQRALDAVDCLGPGTLVMGDRLYCAPELFRTLERNECFGLFRRTKALSINKVRRLSRRRVGEGIVEDWIVRAGQGSKALELRFIRFKNGRKTYEALTNVLDPERLSAEDIVALYPHRWSVERLFYDLKVVLKLKKLHAANPNAIAMQVYAAAMVHTAFRIAQADIARKVGLPPEELSPRKLFPALAVASMTVLEAECVFDETEKANPGVKLVKPTWENLHATVVPLAYIRVQRRSGRRKKRKYDPKRCTWKAITRIKGGRKLT